ncbi:hypothetical protein XENORESO_000743 [Xenotaenia resolanae]|uniref:Uncharacterized protein n=1 Tax=Xenotaenia resolanae TaxID=208358 RepID=A0ABV0VU29_9TELE
MSHSVFLVYLCATSLVSIFPFFPVLLLVSLFVVDAFPSLCPFFLPSCPSIIHSFFSFSFCVLGSLRHSAVTPVLCVCVPPSFLDSYLPTFHVFLAGSIVKALATEELFAITSQ